MAQDKKVNIGEIINSAVSQFKDFLESLKINEADIHQIAKDYPSRKARYNISLEKAKVELAKAKTRAKIVYYELYREYRESGNNNGKKLTEEYLKALITTDQRYIEALKEVLRWEEIVGILQASKEALEDVGRMLFLLIEDPEKKYGF